MTLRFHSATPLSPTGTFQLLGPVSWPCHNYTLTQNLNEQQFPCSSSSFLVLSRARRDSQSRCQVRSYGALLSILYSAQRTTICTAIHTQVSHPWLWYLTDFPYWLPLFYFSIKLSIRHLFFPLCHTFSPASSKAHARTNKRDDVQKQETAWFLATAPTNCKAKNKGRKRISYCSTTIHQSGSLQHTRAPTFKWKLNI